jgi:hypothetical protein
MKNATTKLLKGNLANGLKAFFFIALIMLSAGVSRAQYWTIATCTVTSSTTYGPMYSTSTANATNRMAVIYPSSQLTGIVGQTLTNMYFQRATSTGSMAGTPNFKIYLKEVSASDWGSTSPTWATEISGATLVYDGNPASIVGSTSGWKSFPFLTNFLYSGSQNLAVFTEYTNATASASISWNYEYGTTCISTTNNNTSKYSNNTTGTLPATLASSNYRRPVIGFDYTVPGCTGTPVAGTLNLTTQAICPGTTPAALVATGYTSGAAGLTYQWEESDDNGASDPWAPVTGGSGSSTASFTPPSFTGNTIYYRFSVTCANGGGADYSSSSAVTAVTTPLTPVSAITTSNVTNTGMTISWTNGSGNRRYVVISNTNNFTQPVDGQTGPAVAGTSYTGTGEQIVYDGTGSTVTVSGLACNTTYYVRVYEYQRCGTAAPYNYLFNTSSSATNPASAATISPLSASAPVSNDFTGYTGSNLPTVMPGWYEGTITTTGGTTPSQSNPNTANSVWLNSTVLGSTTAKVNMYTNTRNAWIVSPLMNITTASRLKFKAAITDDASASADPAGMQGTDDKVYVLVSTDGCGAIWTPIHTFSASNTTGLTNVLTDYNILLSAYTGQTIQVALQATDGPVDDAPDYDFHIGSIVVEPVPSCDEPTGLSSSSVTSGGAIINWNASVSAPANGYEYYVSTTNTAPSASTTATGSVSAGTTTATLTGLSPVTTYYVWVRSVCSASSSSNWSSYSTFTTACGAYTLPFSETFATYVPSCWTEQVGILNTATTLTGTTSAWVADDWLNAAANGKAAKINLFAASKKDWLISPSIDLGNGGNNQLEFDIAFLDYANTYNLNIGSDDTLAVVISTDNGATWSLTNALQVWNTNNTGTLSQHVVLPLSAYTGMVKIGFYGSEGVVNDTNDVDVMIDNFTVNATPLAIKLTEINATNVGTRNQVNWTTSTELQGDAFELEKSIDGQNFRSLAKLNSNGVASAYSYWDETPAAGINYYRLKLLDASGSFTYSKVVTATVAGSSSFSVQAYPNPVTDKVTVKINGTMGTNGRVEIVDISGKTIKSQLVTNNTAVVSTSELPSGVYLVKYTDSNHTEVLKITKN